MNDDAVTRGNPGHLPDALLDLPDLGLHLLEIGLQNPQLFLACAPGRLDPAQHQVQLELGELEVEPRLHDLDARLQLGRLRRQETGLAKPGLDLGARQDIVGLSDRHIHLLFFDLGPGGVEVSLLGLQPLLKL